MAYFQMAGITPCKYYICKEYPPPRIGVGATLAKHNFRLFQASFRFRFGSSAGLKSSRDLPHSLRHKRGLFNSLPNTLEGTAIPSLPYHPELGFLSGIFIQLIRQIRFA